MAGEQIVEREIVRDSNIELLRIFSMFLIVVHHFCMHGIFVAASENITLLLKLNNFITGFCAIGGKIGVCLFVMITGYFMIKKSWNFKSFLSIYLNTWIYSATILAIIKIFDLIPLTKKAILVSLFPFFGHAYWFVTTFLLLYLFIPYINQFIMSFVKSSLWNKYKFIFLTTFFLILIPTFFKTNYKVENLTYFIYFYVIGALIRLKTFNFLCNQKLFKYLSILSILCICSYILYLVVTSTPTMNLFKAFKLANLSSIFVLIISIWLFNMFSKLEIPYNKVINSIASSTFAVYLIHDNDLIRRLLWRDTLNAQNLISSKYFLLYTICIPLGVFLICVLIDKIYSPIYRLEIDYIVTRINVMLSKFHH